MQIKPIPILLVVACITIGGCYPRVNVEPLSFSHENEMVRNDDFIVLVDRRVFAVMAFMNACGFDEEFPGKEMHPVRIDTRKAIQD